MKAPKTTTANTTEKDNSKQVNKKGKIKPIKILNKILGVSICLGGMYYYVIVSNLSSNDVSITPTVSNKPYTIMQGKSVIAEFDLEEDAIERAADIARAVVVDNESNTWIFTKFAPFIIIKDNGIFDFDSFEQAWNYAKNSGGDKIYYKDNQTIIWEKDFEVTGTIELNVPHIRQLPELGRGCEVTSLAMILNYFGVEANKMQLAEEVAKDTTPYRVDSDGTIYYGNPYDGFVGNMYDLRQSGYGVYHGPIYDLANTYLPDQVIDLTGADFEELLQFISNGYPVWVVTNGSFQQLPADQFELWHTPTGVVEITKRMHAVVLTGYSDNQVIINDPLYSYGGRWTNLEDFQKSWEQMGHQAVVIID